MKKIVCLLLFIVSISISPYAQEIISEYVAKDIKSVKLHREEWNLSYPVITLGGSERLVLHFDLLGEETNTYYYTFIHCNKDWHPSDIYTTDYLDGFFENPITDYKMSFNTTVNYIHYSVTFPNQDIRFNYSGNYIIKIYRMGEPDDPVLVKRFMVSENRVEIETQPQRSKLTSLYNTHQQIDFIVNHQGLPIQDPYRSVYASILQNGRWDKARSNLQPDFIGDNKLVYNDLSGRTIFPGGNEFRYFDIKSIRYITEYIRRVEYLDGRYHVYLIPSDSRAYKQYFYWQDFNGKYYTAIQEGRDHEVESDYLNVYFTLNSDFPVKDGDVYVYGALTNWMLGDENRMFYNSEEHRYELTLPLKQGWYNYIFVTADSEGNLLEENIFESDHFETENDYIILIYLRDPMERFDRIIGSRIVNTLSR